MNVSTMLYSNEIASFEMKSHMRSGCEQEGSWNQSDGVRSETVRLIDWLDAPSMHVLGKHWNNECSVVRYQPERPHIDHRGFNGRTYKVFDLVTSMYSSKISVEEKQTVKACLERLFLNLLPNRNEAVRNIALIRATRVVLDSSSKRCLLHLHASLADDIVWCSSPNRTMLFSSLPASCRILRLRRAAEVDASLGIRSWPDIRR